ncbi:MAG: hypothetical protein ABIF01_03995 [Candidatus Micrarchaeota archaeon]
MLIEEIEDAEKQAESILSEAQDRGASRISEAKSKSYERIVGEAREKGERMLGQSEKQAKEEAKGIEQKKRRFFLPAEARHKLANSLSEKVVNLASI